MQTERRICTRAAIHRLLSCSDPWIRVCDAYWPGLSRSFSVRLIDRCARPVNSSHCNTQLSVRDYHSAVVPILSLGIVITSITRKLYLRIIVMQGAVGHRKLACCGGISIQRRRLAKYLQSCTLLKASLHRNLEMRTPATNRRLLRYSLCGSRCAIVPRGVRSSSL